MKRISVCLVAAVLGLVLSAAPAFAQRDPFDPVIDLTADTTGGATTGDTGDTAGGNGDPTSPGGSDTRADVFPNTGADTTGWLAIAYVLLASGAALLVYVRTVGRPVPASRAANRRL